MASPIRPSLYRSLRIAVICGLMAVVGVHVMTAQVTRKGKEKSPRALGLVELAPDGKARLIPIAIMVDGKFYDASAYKASPVPLALWSETVYEGETNGVSQGLFTVAGAVRAGTNWFAEGKWQPAGSAPATPRHTDSKPVLEKDEGPPKLRRPDAQKPQPDIPPPTSPAPTPPAENKTPSPSESPSTSPAPDSKPAPPGADETASTSSGSENDTDPNRPVLHRGKNETFGSKQPATQLQTAGKSVPASGARTADKKSSEKKFTHLIPAISDAGGPDPRPYAYDIKPDEDQKFRQRMLAMATEAVQARAKQISPMPASPKPASPAARSTRPAKAPQPTFEDIQFRAFDLWNTNEPVFVLTATAEMPKASTKNAERYLDFTYFITLVAKADMYGELRKLQTNVTDDHHLDETPRLELIDAVDADGDGRGEFLFRQISDTGSAWAVYRAGADQLLPLFQGIPSTQ